LKTSILDPIIWPLEPGKRDCEVTINRLLYVLDDEKVVEAVWEVDPAAKPKEQEDCCPSQEDSKESANRPS
jgi:hypothetical protein